MPWSAAAWLVLCASVSGGVGQVAPVLLFETGPAAPGVDDRSLADAVSIYTRDLKLKLEVEPGAPAEVTAASLGRMVALVQSSGARLAFWYQLRREPGSEAEVILYAVANQGGRAQVDAIPVGPANLPGLPRTFALKVRAVLTGTADLEPHVPLPQPALPPQPPPAAPPTPVPPIPAAASRPLALVSAGYQLTLPQDPSLIRHGLALEGAVGLAEHWEAAAAVAVSSEPIRVVPGAGAAKLFDLPLRLGARALWRRGRVTLGAGPTVALHLIEVDGLGQDGSLGSSTDALLGLGGQAIARFDLGGRVAVELGVGAEEVLPDLRFTLHGNPVLEAGGAQLSLGVGLTFPAL